MQERLKTFEAFAGYGSQLLALDMFGVDFLSVGYSEIDPYAILAHKALHGKKILNYGDITKINLLDLPHLDLFTYSFPCQDISIAGIGRGLAMDSGTRSSLLWECFRIIEDKRPKYMMMENVKNLVGKKYRSFFDEWLAKLEALGYNNYWKVTNAKDCGVPQNRERVFCVSILKEIDDGSFKFEEPFDNGVRLKDLLESIVDEKYFLENDKVTKLLASLPGHYTEPTGIDLTINNPKPKEIANCIKRKYDAGVSNQTSDGTGVVVPVITPDRMEKRQNGRRFKEDGDPMFTITSQDRHGILIREATKIGYVEAFEGDSVNTEFPNSETRRGRVGRGVAQTIIAHCNQAVVVENLKQIRSESKITELGLNIVETRKPMLQIRHIGIKSNFNSALHIKMSAFESSRCLRLGNIYNENFGTGYSGNVWDKKGLCPSLNTMQGGNRQPLVLQKYRIRKLTPRECFRLMGLYDHQIDKIQSTGISNAQQYKLAGNSIVVQQMSFFKNLPNVPRKKVF